MTCSCLYKKYFGFPYKDYRICSASSIFIIIIFLLPGTGEIFSTFGLSASFKTSGDFDGNRGSRFAKIASNVCRDCCACSTISSIKDFATFICSFVPKIKIM